MSTSEKKKVVSQANSIESSIPRVDIGGRDILLRAAISLLNMTPWKLALLYVFVGIGALSFFYASLALFDSPLLDLRGLFTYYSATLGDGVLIPLAIGVSARILKDMNSMLSTSLSQTKNTELLQRASALELRLGHLYTSWLPAVLAIVVTIVVHAIWLLDIRTTPNWTMPNKLNFFGYWHAAFFLLTLWWIFAFISRLMLVSYYLFSHARTGMLINDTMAIWGNLNVFIAALAGFASLLFVDNLGAEISWQSILGNVSTMACTLSVVVLLVVTNIYFFRHVYRPSQRVTSNEQITQLAQLAKRSYIAFFLGLLLIIFSFGLAMTLSIFAEGPVTILVCGLLIPLLFIENYMADLFWNHDQTPDPVQTLGAVLTFFLSSCGLLFAANTALASRNTPNNLANTLAKELLSTFGMSVLISGSTLLLCITVAWIVSTITKGEYLTDHRPMHNMIQNFVQFWALFQFIFVPICIFVDRTKTTFEDVIGDTMTSTMVGGFTAFVVLVVGFPLKMNYDHLRDLEKRRSEYASFDIISAHILFIDLYVSILTFFILAWLWLSYFGLIPAR